MLGVVGLRVIPQRFGTAHPEHIRSKEGALAKALAAGEIDDKPHRPAPVLAFLRLSFLPAIPDLHPMPDASWRQTQPLPVAAEEARLVRFRIR